MDFWLAGNWPTNMESTPRTWRKKHAFPSFSSDYYARYPLVIVDIAIENDHLERIFPLKKVIFHGYVCLPEGSWSTAYRRPWGFSSF